jgi:hypothetical protein
MAGLDKEAVSKAVKTKYNDVVKSEEYLEKVFDITFSMPKTFSLEKYLSNHFIGSIKVYEDSKEHSYASIINHFFSSIHFTTPRHIKKVLNKYEIIKTFKNNDKIPDGLRSLIPNLINEKGEGDLFETIFCLFFIILYENYPDEFSRIENYNRKMSNYIEPFINGTQHYHQKSNSIVYEVVKQMQINSIQTKSINQLFDYHDNSKKIFIPFLFIFSTDKIKNLSHLDEKDIEKYGSFFYDNGILTLFCKFLLKYRNSIIEHKFSDYIFWNYFKMAKYLL